MIVKFVVKNIAVYLFVLYSMQCGAASFDCSLAKSRVEKLICSDELANDLDKKLGDMYKTILSKGISEEVKQTTLEQKKWLIERNNMQDCNIECLNNFYIKRINELSKRYSYGYFNDETSSEDPCATVPSSNVSDKACAAKQVKESNIALRSAFNRYLERNKKYLTEIFRGESIDRHIVARENEFIAWEAWRDKNCRIAELNAGRGTGASMWRQGCIESMNRDKTLFYKNFDPKHDNKYYFNN